MLTSVVLIAALLAHAATSARSERSSEDVVDLPPQVVEALANTDLPALETRIRSLVAAVKANRPHAKLFADVSPAVAFPSSYKRISSSSAFVPWAGKRAEQDKRFQAWAGKRGDKPFRSWSGKRASDPDYDA